MKRCTTLLLPLLFLTVSCGITVQYPGQRFEDGIYGSRVTREVHIYSPEEFEDMAALEKVSSKEVSDILESAYRSYIKRDVFPRERKEYSENDYYDYKIQCAFRVAYKVLEGEHE